MADPALRAALDRLQAVPLGDFVAERKRLARELRAGGDREAAAEVARARKPTPPAWALNRAARESPDVLSAWLDAAAALREATAHPARDALRAAMAAHRAATARLAGAAAAGAEAAGTALSAPMLDRVRELLQAATADPALADALRAGRVSEDREPGEVALPEADEAAATGGATAPEGEDEEDDVAAAAAERRAAAKRAAAAERAELERRIEAAAQEVERRRQEVERRRAAAEAAAARLEEARRTLHRRESEHDAASDALLDAERAAAAVDTTVRELRGRLRRAG